ncbi:DUF2752 domain-containing protein [Hoyosella sp. G463]|uniref:DUF2752 domain-containing protein n=1 Tax=Lolliginicoccus lacisalsi TaxID=2742202 RepID=A0A927JBG7_9ACTN|nr:DUF2752 domain-containing protein [Lolliginicoccus lacisalsi]MBD8505362.1 DUF2752 domain-containing protein [Lolliginicoccus lacisalsi]
MGEARPASRRRRGAVLDTARSLAAPAGVALAASAGCIAINWADPTTPGGIIPECPSKLLFGVNCPGCGSTRMVYSLIRGDLGGAIAYNALGVAALILVLWSYGAWTAGLLRGRFVRSWQHLRWAPLLVLSVVLAWFIARNIPVEPFVSLRV